MARSRLPLVVSGCLHFSEELENPQAPIAVESDAWYAWLITEPNRSFAFKNDLGTFTARRERKRHGWYWYIYRKHQGKLLKAYLGKTEEVTLARLSTITEALMVQDESSSVERKQKGVNKHTDINSAVSPVMEEFPQGVLLAPSESKDTLPLQQRLVITPQAEHEQASKQNLAVQHTPLIGREKEIAAICALLRQPEVRLLTLTGPGGIGKTRLGLQAAADVLSDFADGVYFVQLAPFRDPELVVPTIAQALGIKETGGQPYFPLLKALLREKQVLLLLDNFEQIVITAPRLSELLMECVRLKILITSRALLHISGEREFLVPPLVVPDLKHLPTAERLSEYAAVALFCHRAQMIQPDFQITSANASSIAEICVRLDGLPLAIELAAARSKLLSPQALLRRLEYRLAVLTGGEQDAPLRQQTLRNTLQWSYDLLDAVEQRLFRHLAIFVGGCQLSVIEALCAELGDAGMSVLDGVASLVDKNLLKVMAQDGDEPRLMMLETVREYGLECLVMNGEMERTQVAYATVYHSFVMQADAVLLGVERETWPPWSNQEQEMWLEWQDREYENLRAALNILLQLNKTELALQFAVGCVNVWFFRGQTSDGRRITERLLADDGVKRSVSHAKGWVLYEAGWLAFFQSDDRHASSLLKESVEVFKNLQYMRGVAACLTVLGNIEQHQGDIQTGEVLLEESLALYRALRDHVGIAYALLTQGILIFFRGDLPRTYTLCEESLRHSRIVGQNWLIASNLHYLGWILFLQGAYASARQLSSESVDLFKKIGLAGFAVEAQIVLASELAALGDEETAQRLLEDALAYGRRVDSRIDIARALCGLGVLALGQHDLTRAYTCYEEAVMMLKQGQEIPDRVQWVLASCLEGMGEIALARGQAVWAVRLFARADALRVTDTYRNTIGIEQPHYEHLLATAIEQLGRGTFAALWTEGKQMTTDRVLVAKDTERIVYAALPAGLTRREFEVLRLLTEGLPNAQIAERLVISLTTVNSYLSSIYSKLGVSSRLGAMRYAMDNHLLN